MDRSQGGKEIKARGMVSGTMRVGTGQLGHSWDRDLGLVGLGVVGC